MYFKSGLGRWLLALGLGLCVNAQAHLMVAQKGTLNLQGDGAYMVVSLPVSAFKGVDEDGDGRWSVAELGAHTPQIHQQLAQHLQLRDAQGLRPMDGVTLIPTPDDDQPDAPVTQLVVMARFMLAQTLNAQCAETAQGLVLHARLFGLQPVEQQLSIAVTQGAHKQLVVFRPGHEAQALFPSGWRVVVDYVQLGILHIVTGWDHLLFLCVVLLGGGTWRQIFGILSAFTLGHALTLAWGLMGSVPFSPRGVESGIAATIVFMASLEWWMRRRAQPIPMAVRLVCVFVCALIHGLGLASSLQAVGLDPEHRVWSLLGFNVGVELAQAGIAWLASMGWWVLMRRLQVHHRASVHQGFTALSVLLGGFWWVERLL